jgi:hypothetical protein
MIDKVGTLVALYKALQGSMVFESPSSHTTHDSKKYVSKEASLLEAPASNSKS